MIEKISAKVHEQWMATKHAQGVTSRKSESGEELMVPYEQLSEGAKDLDRGTVRAVLEAIGVRDCVLWFAQHMETRLRANEGKGGWRDCGSRWLVGRARHEFFELEEAMYYKRSEDIIHESADVANFAMMIADNSHHASTQVPAQTAATGDAIGG